jgi:outer membrane protein
MIKYSLYTAFILFIADTSYSQNFTLYEAQSYALENTEQIKNALIDMEIAKQKVNETRAIGLPQVSAEGNFSNFINLPIQVVDGEFIGQPGTLVSFRAGTDFSMNGGVGVNQLIFDGSYIVGLQVSKFYQEFVAANTTLTQQEVLINVTRAYELALVSRESMRYMDTLVESTQLLAEKQAALVELGLLGEEELDQINYALASAKTNQVAAKYNYENARSMLKLAMGYPMQDQIQLMDNLSSVLSDAINSQSESSINNNIQLDLLEKRKELAKYEVKNAKFANLPSLGGFFQHRYDAYRNEFNFLTSNGEWFEQTFWGLRLNVPITSSGARISRQRQAELELKQREFEIQQFKRTLEMQEVSYRNDFLAAQERLKLQKDNVGLATKIYNNSLQRAEIGRESSILVTQKYGQVVTAHSQYIGAMVDVFNAKLNIDQLYNTINR